MGVERANAWLCTIRAVKSPRVRLLCFPYAGGGATIYFPWARHLPDDVEVTAVQLPARQERLRERGITKVEEIAENVHRALDLLPPARVALYGHSFGALLAFELACLRPVTHLVVGARQAPHLPQADPIAELPAPEFVDRLRQRYGAPAALRDPALLELVEPALRADFRALEGYEHVSRPALTSPITVLSGTLDASVSPEGAAAWRRHTSGPFAHRTIAAGHLFVETHRDEVLRVVREATGTLDAGRI